MRELLRSLSLIALAALAAPALAQQTTDEPTAEAETPEAPQAAQPGDTSPETPAQEAAEAEPDAPAAEPQQADPNEPYLRETFQDWGVVCVRVSADREACYMSQTLADDRGNPVAQVSITPLPPEASPRAAAVELATPLDVLLSEDVLLSVDGTQPKRYRYTFCRPQACFARFALSTEEVTEFKAGAKATVVLVPLAAPDQAPQLTMSLSGFTAAFEAVPRFAGQ